VEDFQRVTVDSGLMLFAHGSIQLDADRLHAEYADMSVGLPKEHLTAYRQTPKPEEGWTSVLLSWDGVPAPALAYFPTLREFLSRPEINARRAFINRQAPGGELEWHYDNQGLHREEARLLLPIHAPEGAVTWIGHEAGAAPDGRCWTGDVAFPHRVVNPTDRERVVMVFDVAVTDVLRSHFPAELSARGERRLALAERAQTLFLAWKTARGAA